MLDLPASASESQQIMNRNLKIINAKQNINHKLLMKTSLNDKTSKSIIKQLITKKVFCVKSEEDFKRIDNELVTDPIIVKQFTDQIQKLNSKTAGTLITNMMDSVFDAEFKTELSWSKIKTSEIVKLMMDVIKTKFDSETGQTLAHKFSQHIRTAKLSRK